MEALTSHTSSVLTVLSVAQLPVTLPEVDLPQEVLVDLVDLVLWLEEVVLVVFLVDLVVLLVERASVALPAVSAVWLVEVALVVLVVSAPWPVVLVALAVLPQVSVDLEVLVDQAAVRLMHQARQEHQARLEHQEMHPVAVLSVAHLQVASTLSKHCQIHIADGGLGYATNPFGSLGSLGSLTGAVGGSVASNDVTGNTGCKDVTFIFARGYVKLLSNNHWLKPLILSSQYHWNRHSRLHRWTWSRLRSRQRYWLLRCPRSRLPSWRRRKRQHGSLRRP
jgi:hypothetical protein